MTSSHGTIRTTLGLALAAGMLAAAPAAALADAPSAYTDEFSFAFPIDDFLGCGEDVLLEERGTARITEFVDRDGEVRRVHIQFRSDVTITGDHAVLTQKLRYADVVDVSEGTISYHGVNLAKGPTGRLEIEAGRTVFDLASGELVTASGVNTFADGDDSAACAALAG